MYPRKIKTAPAAEPVVFDSDMDDWLRVTESDQQELIEFTIQAAREQAELVTARAFITQTWEMWLDEFPSEIVVPLPPLQSVPSIKYIDTDGVEQTLDSSVYTVNTNREPGLIYLAYDQSWPAVRAIRDAITVEFVCGYGAAATDVPARARAAIKLLAAHWFENSEAVVVGAVAKELPMAVASLLAGLDIPEAA